MRLPAWSSLALFLAFASAGCGTPANRCDGVTCPSGQGCDTQTGACVLLQPDDACGNVCKGTTPVCDTSSRSCRVCTASAGCSGAKPVCNTAVSLGACVQCTTDAHCGGGQVCDLASSACKARTDAGMPEGPDAGQPDAGSPGSCPQGCSGLTPHCEPNSGDCVACLENVHCGTGGQCDTATFACEQGTCVVPLPPVPCSTTCNEGFLCQGGACVLRGAAGPVQVTLRWDTETDLDLSLTEPKPQGTCKIWFSDPNQPGNPSTCGAEGSLDLDSNAGCVIDGVNVENVIYPAGAAAPSGTYTVEVVNYDPCQVNTDVPFEVTVRANGQTQVYCDSFAAGSQGSSKTISVFTVP